MSERLLAALMASNSLKAVDPAELKATLGAWKPRRVEAGELLWRRGRPADELAIVHRGKLQVEIAREVMGSVMAGDLLGEAGAFLPGSQRSADVRALERSTLIVMDTLRLRKLRQQGSPLYEALLRQAAVTSVRRVRRATAWVAKVAERDTEAPKREEVSALARMWRALRPGLPQDPPPPLPPLLRAQPGLDQAPPEAILALASAFEPVAVPEGEVLVLEGDNGERLDAMYLVAAGTIDVLRHVRGGAKRLVTLRAGGQFGCNALVEAGPRTASCVATSPAWLYKLPREAFRDPPRQGAVWWYESVVRNVAGQLQSCDAMLVEALRVDEEPEPQAQPKKRKRSETFRDLLDGAGFGAGDFSESELDRVEVVYDEAQLRRRDPKP